MKFILILSVLLLSSNSFAANQDKANRLIKESSPYLLQHAYNPVDWYPWGEEAFDKARRENKPVFISIGYSTCHWCHVMAHESFENQKIADLLNKDFISIKVDREERPDIDRIYLTATEILNGFGGWPTTIVANTELKPFFANTYIPPFSKNGQKGLEEILNKVMILWQEDRQTVDRVANEVTDLLKQHLQANTKPGKLNPDSIRQSYLKFENSFDDEFGGFGNAPKFPRMAVFDFLLEYGKTHPDSKAHTMIRTSFEHILRSGLYDQVGGGFHRYAVDAQWQVPHFEKMLYDQGLIINSLVDTAQLVPNPEVLNAIKKSADFVLSQMHHPKGGFYSAYDADSTRPDKPSEHGEGAYYVWSEAEIRPLLSPTEFKLLKQHYNLQAKGNVHSDPQNEFTGLNILHAETSLSETAKSLKLDIKVAQVLLKSAQDKLLKQRLKRPLPHLDDKIITAWNGLTVKALSKAAGLLKTPSYQKAAIENATFIYQNLYNPVSKQLYRSYRDGKQSGEAYLDDYAYLINGLLSLYQQSQDRQWLIWADTLMQQQIALFSDQQYGGFFDNTQSDRNILIRSKEAYDGSLPSANATSVENLLLLAKLMNKPQWQTLANKTLNAFHDSLNELYENHPQMYRNALLLKH